MDSRSTSSRRQPYAIMDVGSYRIGCAIVDPISRALLAVANTPSAGVQAGHVRDVHAAHGAIVRGIVEAERMAGVQAVSALIGVTGAFIKAERLAGDMVLDPPIATCPAISRLRTALLSYVERGGRTIIHTEGIGYRLDGRLSPTPPLDRFGRSLEIDLTVVTMDSAPLHRLLDIIEATELPVCGVVPAGLAASLAVTSSADRQGGIAVVDIGHEQTTIAIHAAGRLTGLGSVAIGMHHVISETAEVMHVSLENAERIIQERGMASLAPVEQHGVVTRQWPSGPTMSTAPHGPGIQDAGATCQNDRLATLLRLVADRLDASGAALSPQSGVVLVGGGGGMPGLAAYAAYQWARPVRVGGPVWPNGDAAPVQAAVLAGLVQTVDAVHGVRFDRGGLRRTA